MTLPDMKLVRANARKHRIKGSIQKSDRKNKKLVITRPDGKRIHFGNSAYEDFTRHRDIDRRKNYCKRSAGIKDKDGKKTRGNPGSANYYSMKLLWDC